VEGVAESAASLSRLLSGWISDRARRRKPIVVSGYSLSGLTRPLIALATASWQVLVARFIDRIGKGIRTPPRDALIVESSPPGRLGKAFGFHRSMDHLGAVIGPIAAAAILMTLSNAPAARDYRILFSLATVPAVLCVLVLLLAVRESPRPLAGKSHPSLTAPALHLFDRRFKAFLGVLLLFTLGNSSDAFLLLRAQDTCVPVKHLPLLWATLHIVKTFASVPCGALSDRIGRRRVIIAGWLLYSAVYLGFACAENAFQTWTLFVVYGVYFGLTEGASSALVADLVPGHLRGTAYGVYHCVVGAAALPASLAMGMMWRTFGPPAAFGVGAAFAVTAAISFALTVSTRKEG
ncbi:MAG: hypothetical protein A3K13_07555, partial [Gemmatimonadetes bacterium RIFCSPLOWO2_12_FULL_68_9]